ncbi:MAG: hypothetical protein ACXW32_17535 [Limisphaerales bacterium]
MQQIAIGKTSLLQQISGMSTVGEIESALKELPLQQVQEIAHWLERYLEQASLKATSTKFAAVELPDYATRRHMIFGDHVLPNMVLLSREEERW